MSQNAEKTLYKFTTIEQLEDRRTNVFLKDQRPPFSERKSEIESLLLRNTRVVKHLILMINRKKRLMNMLKSKKIALV